MQDGGVTWSTVALVLLVIVGAIMAVFMGYLVRTAYELKIEMKARLDRGLRAVDEESGKKARGLRQELGADIERARAALFEEARRKLSEATAEMTRREAEFESAVRQERIQLSVTLDALRDEVAAQTTRIYELERELLIGGGFDQGPTQPSPARSVTR
jgi:hypothetical protein